MITIKATRDGFVMYGSTVDTIEYVCNVNVGLMADGLRHLTKEECTEALLQEIESKYNLTVWV